MASLLRYPRAYLTGILAAALAGPGMAVPTALLPNPLFTRMTPVRPWDWAFWALGTLLIGAIGMTYGAPRPSAACANRTMGGGVLNALAIGCPICNKVAVALLGVSGALSYWAPVQPLVGLAGLGLLGWALLIRLGLRS